jgi:predicted choloylglycine hydrolase
MDAGPPGVETLRTALWESRHCAGSRSAPRTRRPARAALPRAPLGQRAGPGLDGLRPLGGRDRPQRAEPVDRGRVPDVRSVPLAAGRVRMEKTFRVEREDRPGGAWLERFRSGRDEAARWYLGDAADEGPTAAECRAALQRYMPELLPHYDDVCGLIGDDELGHRMLSHYRPAARPQGCSQAVWLGPDGPALVRNYDYPLPIITGRIELSAWSRRRVIAMAQRPWGGCLDGMNDDGLVASCTLGGLARRGVGFAIILLLRYVLETCGTVGEAVAALCRIPVTQLHNVTVLDGTGAYATVFLGPRREPAVTRLRACTNHQERVSPASGSALRQRVLDDALSAPSGTLAQLTALFFALPLYSRKAAFTTAYTAVYRPAERRVDYLWPGHRLSQTFDRFQDGAYTHQFGALDQ